MWQQWSLLSENECFVEHAAFFESVRNATKLITWFRTRPLACGTFYTRAWSRYGPSLWKQFFFWCLSFPSFRNVSLNLFSRLALTMNHSPCHLINTSHSAMNVTVLRTDRHSTLKADLLQAYGYHIKCSFFSCFAPFKDDIPHTMRWTWLYQDNG